MLVTAQNGNDLLQQGLAKERANGDIQGAIKIYERIVKEFQSNRPLVAKATLQLGAAYEKLGATYGFMKANDRCARQLRKHQRPMIVTQNGEPAMVLLAPEEYDRLTYRARFLSAIDEGLADSKAGRVVSDAQLRKTLDAKLGNLPR